LVWNFLLQDRNPIFLRPPPLGHLERIWGYVLLVEYREHLAVLKVGLELISSFKTMYLDRVPRRDSTRWPNL
jgi:hypothetical protein